MKRLVLVAVVCACAKPPAQGLPPAAEGSNIATAGSNDLPGHPPVTRSPDPMPADHPPVAGANTLTKLADGRHVLGPYAVAVPAGWTEVATTSKMRAAQFTVGDAELVIYYFGSDGAGSVQDNIDRWVAQFPKPDGKPTIEATTVAGHDATIVSVSGRYETQQMPGGPAPVDKPDQSLLAAITGSPSGPYYWKLVGPRATVSANAAKFRAMLTTLKVR